MDAHKCTDQRLAALRAQATSIRCVLHATVDGKYLLTRTAWGMSKLLVTLDDVGRQLRLMGATA